MGTINLAIAGATGWTGSAIADGALDCPGHHAEERDRAPQRRPGPRHRPRTRPAWRPGARGRRRGARRRRRPRRVHLARARQGDRVGRDRARRRGRDRLKRADRRRLPTRSTRLPGPPGVGAVAAGNFSLTAAMMLAGAELAARHLPQLGDHRLRQVGEARRPERHRPGARRAPRRKSASHRSASPIDQVAGRPDARGATVAGTQIHSVRVPSFVVSTEIVFAAADERLSIRHDAGATASPVRHRRLAGGPTRPRTRRPRSRPRPPPPRHRRGLGVTRRPTGASSHHRDDDLALGPAAFDVSEGLRGLVEGVRPVDDGTEAS